MIREVSMFAKAGSHDQTAPQEEDARHDQQEPRQRTWVLETKTCAYAIAVVPSVDEVVRPELRPELRPERSAGTVGRAELTGGTDLRGSAENASVADSADSADGAKGNTVRYSAVSQLVHLYWGPALPRDEDYIQTVKLPERSSFDYAPLMWPHEYRPWHGRLYQEPSV